MCSIGVAMAKGVGYMMGSDPAKPELSVPSTRGTHGWFPTHPEMRATFILNGPGLPKKKLDEIDMRDIAPTLAKLAGTSMPSAASKPLF